MIRMQALILDLIPFAFLAALAAMVLCAIVVVASLPSHSPYTFTHGPGCPIGDYEAMR